MGYKLIIVDDEKIIREGLTNFFDWNSIGIEISGVFSDGEEALEFIKNNRIDIVLTDIKMKKVSGIDVAKYIYENLPQIKVIFMSGYKEFELAQKAIELNVKFYILKPATLNEIMRVFSEVISDLDRNKEKLQKQSEKDKKYDDLLYYLQQQFFNDVFMGGLRKREELEKRMKIAQLDIDAENSNCCIIKLKINNFEHFIEEKWEYGIDRFKVMLFNFIQGEENGIIYYMAHSKASTINVIAISKSKADEAIVRDLVEERFNSVKTAIFGIAGVEIDFSVENVFKNLFELSSQNITMNTEMIFSKTEVQQSGIGYADSNSILDKQKLFVSYINAGNFESVSSLLDSFMEEFVYFDIKTVKTFYIDLFSMIIIKLREAGINVTKDLQNKLDYQVILSFKNLGELQTYCKGMLKDLIKNTAQFRETSEIQIINKAKKFIKENCNRDISLDEVANHVFLSPVYFSKLFKKITDENFIDYVIKLRIEKAMELLKDPKYKVYEIRALVGYSSNKYFARLFKQYTGYTVTEYRNNILNSGEAENG